MCRHSGIVQSLILVLCEFFSTRLVDQRLDGTVVQPGSNKPWPAALWHLKPVRDPPPKVYHRASLFGVVRGDASHFKIHPDWPDYQADVVH